MKSVMLWSLIALNGLLVAGVLERYLKDNSAIAQVRRPAEYLLVPGEVNGLPTGLIFVIDSTNGQLGAFAFDDGNSRLDVMPPLDLARALEAAGGQPAPPR